MQFCTPPDRPLRPPRLRLDIVLECPDQARTIALDLDRENTTIATIQTFVADEIKAEWRTLGLRVLRDSLPAARVVLRSGERELGMKDTLRECGINDRSEIAATVKFTDEEARLMRARTRKAEEMEKRRTQRKIVGKPTARMKAGEVANVSHQETENKMEEIAPEAEEHFAEDTKVLDADFAVMEDLRIEELDEQHLDEVRHAERNQIRVEIPHEGVVQAAEEDAFEEEDADKENWNPQILRSVGGEQGAPRVA